MRTIERINELAAERVRLFGKATNGQRGDQDLRVRISVIAAELERLWDQRRLEKAGRADGIDRLIDRQYEGLYGRDEAPRVTQQELAELAA